MLQNLDLNSAAEIDLDDLMRFSDAAEWRGWAATKIASELCGTFDVFWMRKVGVVAILCNIYRKVCLLFAGMSPRTPEL